MDVVSLVSIIICLSKLSYSLDTITKHQPIRKGEILASKSGRFELGFFSLSDSSGKLLGTKQKKENPMVWVSNRHSLIKVFSGVLNVNDSGNAILTGHENNSLVIWSTNKSEKLESPSLELFDNGNSGSSLWKNRVLVSVSSDQCDDYSYCGPNGMCDVSKAPVCYCPKGFKPKSPDTPSTLDFKQGCVRNKPLSCQEGDRDGFIEYVGMRVPKQTNSWADKSLSVKECKEKCLKNCSCVGFSSSAFGCSIWFDEMVGVRHALDGGQSLFIRMSSSQIEHQNKVKIAIAIAGSALVVIVGVFLAFYFIRRNRTNLKENIEKNGNEEAQKDDLNSPLFNLSTITAATKNFSPENKLGQGGFGVVYKGTLEDGQEIAVKRLSKRSGQVNEFKNEVILIAKLQHRNLVRLLGCCIEGQERLLIYEYMPNKSLDYYIFDRTLGTALDWLKRFNIILGIVRGLIYLHQDSRLRIIHRDLKASNVLLDSNMNPKISDFGLARTFGGDQMEAFTNRVAGTFGYMAPEYAIDGNFSVKSDVFSFGILMLEIVSGKRNRGFYNPAENMNLVGHAWELWNKSQHLDLIDECLGDDSLVASKALRCIHVALLCVQKLPEDRPSMSRVLLMLGDERDLPCPKEPGFFLAKKAHSSEADFSSSTKQETSSNNDYTISLVCPR